MSAVRSLLGEGALAEARSGIYVAEQVRAQLLLLSGNAGAVRAHCETGLRHTVLLRFEGFDEVACGETLVALLPDHEFIIPGHQVASAAVLDVDQRQAARPVLNVTVQLLLEDD